MVRIDQSISHAVLAVVDHHPHVIEHDAALASRGQATHDATMISTRKELISSQHRQPKCGWIIWHLKKAACCASMRLRPIASCWRTIALSLSAPLHRWQRRKPTLRTSTRPSSAQREGGPWHRRLLQSPQCRVALRERFYRNRDGERGAPAVDLSVAPNRAEGRQTEKEI
jgi:hypothetical protein